MKSLFDYLVLPSEISAFERQYLKRITRIGLFWFLCHVPAMMIVAGLAHTGILRALVYSVLVVSGPALAFRTLDNPRAVTKICAFAAMCLSGLLVHFGQGSMQIEMHFHFFVTIALLTVFADPLVIVVAAATAAVHHLGVWLLFPASVFNYDASVWAVVVHALFVVFESIAACFVARSFFDNVIGLDRIVQARTAELAERGVQMRRVLDNVDQGLVAVALDGSVGEEQSSALATLVGPSKAGDRLWDWIGRADARFGQLLSLYWEMLIEGALPVEVIVEQLPKRLVFQGRTLEFRYKTLGDAENLRGVLLVVTDITSEVERERAEADQREAMAIFERVRDDRGGVVEFMDEASEIVDSITKADPELDVVKRAIHTLKGNSGLCGLTSLARLCHDVETRIEETGEFLRADRDELRARWDHVVAKLSPLVGERTSTKLEVDVDEHDAVLARLRRGAPREDVVQMIQDWRLESAQSRLARLGEHARQLAERLGKGPIRVLTEANGVRLAPGELRSVWASLMHVVRNAVDHGIESVEERRLAGKPDEATITLVTKMESDMLVVAVSDDGSGVNWSAVKRKAEASGLPHETAADLEHALFADGLSTKDGATEISGRGVGMSAVRAECERLSGSVRVRSSEGTGTTIELRVTAPPRKSDKPHLSVVPPSARAS